MDEIDKLRAAILRTEQTLAEMGASRGPDACPCCHGAAFGGTYGPYDTLERKLDRQDAWLAVLLAKKSGDVPALIKAKARYADVLNRHSKLKRQRTSPVIR